MAEKNLKYFMRSVEDEIVTAPGPDTFLDDEGNVIEFEIKVLSQAEINKINNMYRKRTMAVDKKGNPLVSNGEVIWKEERDNAKASRHMMVEALVYPNLKDKELMDYYHCVDVTDMPLLVFKRPDEYQHVNNIIMTALGLRDSLDEEEANNAEIDEAKN